MFEELDTVVLARNIKEYNLKKGDIGAVVNVYKDGKALEVEFVKAEGETVALLTLSLDDVRSMKRDEILHVRGFNTI
jgi:ATP-dependent exoDNAse (exonuclease V) alpha subunit